LNLGYPIVRKSFNLATRADDFVFLKAYNEKY